MVLRIYISSDTLDTDKINFLEIDFLALPDPPPPLPYMRQWICPQVSILETVWAFYPKDMSIWDCFSLHITNHITQWHYIGASVQTDSPDPDCTLAEIDPDIIIEEGNVSELETKIKKRKQM